MLPERLIDPGDVIERDAQVAQALRCVADGGVDFAAQCQAFGVGRARRFMLPERLIDPAHLVERDAEVALCAVVTGCSTHTLACQRHQFGRQWLCLRITHGLKRQIKSLEAQTEMSAFTGRAYRSEHHLPRVYRRINSRIVVELTAGLHERQRGI